jgi:hypothetical protein
MHDSAVAVLLMTLKEEQAALRSGKFELLLDLEEQKSAQLQALEHKPPSRAELHKIRTKLSENQKLFSAAIAGVRAARERIEALHNVRSGLNTYDKSGAMSTAPLQRSAFEKKA